MKRVRIQHDEFDAGDEISALSKLAGGGIANFVGIVRGDGGLTSLEIEHYPGMTEAALTSLANEASVRWSVLGVTLIHRVGAMVPGEAIVFVGVASRHRAAALDACAFLIDRLKTDAPFWKKEVFVDGRSQWVESRDSDAEAAASWD